MSHSPKSRSFTGRRYKGSKSRRKEEVKQHRHVYREANKLAGEDRVAAMDRAAREAKEVAKAMRDVAEEAKVRGLAVAMAEATAEEAEAAAKEAQLQSHVAWVTIERENAEENAKKAAEAAGAMQQQQAETYATAAGENARKAKVTAKALIDTLIDSWKKYVEEAKGTGTMNEISQKGGRFIAEIQMEADRQVNMAEAAAERAAREAREAVKAKSPQ